jgi:phosphopantothenoylcysteine decarboxylase/phosphopantothenate--cysteine ligase
LRLLVTAGATCEDIDEVRYITNRSSGRMGYAVAAEAARRGHCVTLVSGPTHLPVPKDVSCERVRSAAELLEACLRIFPSCDAMVAAAAVCDYRPARRVAGKLKKSDPRITLELVRNPDIARELANIKSPDQAVVGFALEATDIFESRSSAEAKLADKKQDMAVLNGPVAMGAPGAEFAFFTPEDGWTAPEVLDKGRVAGRVLDYLETRLGCRHEPANGDRA